MWQGRSSQWGVKAEGFEPWPGHQTPSSSKQVTHTKFQAGDRPGRRAEPECSGRGRWGEAPRLHPPARALCQGEGRQLVASLVSRGDAHKWHRHGHTGTSTKHTDTREQSVVFCRGFFSSLALIGDAGGKAGRPSTAPSPLPLPKRKALGATACASAVKQSGRILSARLCRHLPGGADPHKDSREGKAWLLWHLACSALHCTAAAAVSSA